MKLVVGGVALTTTGSVASSCRSDNSSPGPWGQVPEILARIKPPTFPDIDFDVTSYGAVGDGIRDFGAAIKQAILACGEAGGGRVVVPAGRFVTGPIHLESNVNLHVTEGATLSFSTDPSTFLPTVPTRFGGTEYFNYSPCIYAFERGISQLPAKACLTAKRQTTTGGAGRGSRGSGGYRARPTRTMHSLV